MNDPEPKTFEAIVNKKVALRLSIPFLPREARGAQPRYAVTGTINGQNFKMAAFSSYVLAGDRTSQMK